MRTGRMLCRMCEIYFETRSCVSDCASIIIGVMFWSGKSRTMMAATMMDVVGHTHNELVLARCMRDGVTMFKTNKVYACFVIFSAITQIVWIVGLGINISLSPSMCNNERIDMFVMSRIALGFEIITVATVAGFFATAWMRNAQMQYSTFASHEGTPRPAQRSIRKQEGVLTVISTVLSMMHLINIIFLGVGMELDHPDCVDLSQKRIILIDVISRMTVMQSMLMVITLIATKSRLFPAANHRLPAGPNARSCASDFCYKCADVLLNGVLGLLLLILGVHLPVWYGFVLIHFGDIREPPENMRNYVQRWYS